MSRIPRFIVTLGYILVFLILVIDAVLVSADLRTIVRTNVQVDQTRYLITEVERTLSLLKDAETGQRGYVLTGSPEYLVPYDTANHRLDQGLAEIDRLTKDDPAQNNLSLELRRIAAEKRTELAQTIALRRDQGFQAALKVVETDQGRLLMQEARKVVDQLQDVETRVLRQRLEDSQNAVQNSRISFGLTTGTALLLLLGVFYVERRDTLARARAAAALKKSESWLSTTLASIGDAVIATNDEGRVRFMNAVAEQLTGWTQEDAVGKPMDEVFCILNEYTRLPAENPMHRVLREGIVVGLANHTVLISRGGNETPIDDSAAPIKDDNGAVIGVVLVFRDVIERKLHEQQVLEQKRLAEFGRDIGLALTAEDELAPMLQRCAEATVKHLDGALARVWTVDETGTSLDLQASVGIDTHANGIPSRVAIGEHGIGKIAADKLPHLTNSLADNLVIAEQGWAGREGLTSFAGYPLVLEGRLIGVWGLFAKRELSELTLRAMESVAREFALGIERKNIVQSLLKSESRLWTTLNSIGDAVIATDAQGHVRFLNPIAEALTGWTQGEAVGRPMQEVFHILHEYTREETENPVHRVLREGIIVGLANHTVLIARNGEETPIEDSAAPIRDPEGNISGVVMVFRDVTDRRRQAVALRDREDRLQLAIRAADLGTWDYNATDGSLVWDDRCKALFGLSPDSEVTYDLFLEGLHPDDRERLRQLVQDLLDPSNRKELNVEYRAIGKQDGVERWLAARGRSYFDESGRPLRLVGTILDVTEAKERQEELKAAKEEAEQANKAKDQFLAVLSHELRTPLNPILLAVTSMLEGPVPDDEVRPNLEMIQQYVNLQARLIDDLLDVMRIVRGKMPLHWEVVDVHPLIEQAVHICRSEVFGKVLGLDLKLEAEQHHINADPTRLQQVFWNLIKNAVKFTEKGGRITIRTRNEADRLGYTDRLIIEVADTGIGIDDEAMRRIFDPFQQGESSITRRFGGMGLGLAISKGIVEGHGGLLTATSDGIGTGSVFRIELRTLPEPRLDATDRGTNAGEESEPKEMKPRSILLVEDEQATLRLMARLLRGLGHKVTTADNISAALQIERDEDIDLVVSDIGLPDGSGLELMRAIVARRGPVAAIALTGYGMEEDILRSRQAGFTAHMTKPIDFTKLEAMIRQLF